jgi:D-glycero-D-manno-heptose 1,7-bisphosphate phosphatase
MLDLLALGADLFTATCIAPEAPDQPSFYRKPSPRFITESIATYALDPAQCWMIGDRDSDIMAGINAHIHAAAVCTGKYSASAWSTRLPAGATLHADLAALVAALH